MNCFFIDTFELTYKTTFDYIKEKLDEVPKNCVKKGEFYYPVSLEESRAGIDMRTRKCSKGEHHKKGENYKIVLRVATGKIPYFKNEIRHINTKDDFNKMIDYVNKFIEYRLPDLNINDFELTRIDITKDIHGIPEPVIHEYIMLMRRMFIPGKFEHNKQLEENTKNFRKEDSFNALMKKGNTSIVEFVVYNKSRAAIDQKLTDKELEYYKDTMRMEIRCYKKYIKKMTNEESTIEILNHMFYWKECFARREYYNVFELYDGDLTFLNYYWIKKYIEKEINGKPKHKKNMLALSKILDRDSLPDLAKTQSIYSKKHNALLSTMSGFYDLHISPVPIKNKDYPFLQSLSSILEFKEPTSTDVDLYLKLCKRTRQKKLLIHAISEEFYKFTGVMKNE